uniref:uncharacterized protein LOC120329382 n=1 Tax=Styela clava TaxID=7725 RepID=UPI00193A20FD|nr:uncharacterized protein LOC120329382 [Styela clava]
MLIVGGLIMLVSFVGCCGAISESKCMMGLYCVFLILLLLGQIAIGALGIYYGKQEVEASFEEHFMKIIKREAGTDMDVVNSVQEFFECCGYNGPGDYSPRSQPVTTTSASTTIISSSIASVNNTIVTVGVLEKTQVPIAMATTIVLPAVTSSNVNDSTASFVSSTTATTTEVMATTNASTTHYRGGWTKTCCVKSGSGYKNETVCKDASMTIEQLEQYLYETGCKDRIDQFIDRWAVIIGATAIGFAILQIVAIIAGCMLYKSLD